jgi:hypothetical protein
VAPGTYIHQAYICAKESQNVTQIERHTSEFKITPDHLNMLNKSGERHKYDYGLALQSLSKFEPAKPPFTGLP